MSRAADRAAAWVLTGPVGRVVAFMADLGGAWLGWAASKASTKLRGS